MAGQRGVKSVKKSSVPGVNITQFVEDIPKGCSTPDFERKPITLTLQEGKNAIFRAVVKGDPKPEVVWKRNNKDIDDSPKYQRTFSPGTNEFILQINKITSDDSDLYRCTAVNQYGEATCTAGLKIIQVGFKKKTKEVPAARQGDLKKEIQDFRKTLKKRAPSALPKKEIDMEQVWQLLLNADRKDYEKVCLKYGIVDFRGMLRKLQEMRKEREDKQAQYISSITNLRHVRVNEEKGNASFDLEMELKNPESRIYLYKDGQMINFGFDSDTVKHCLRKVGKKYNFIINNLQPEDAGVYQIKVEDVDVFSTDLEAEAIPMSFRYPLGEVRCHEQGNAVFQCTLHDACFNAVWLHKNCHLEPSDKYDISVSEDGLIHRLLIKNTQLSDKGTYTIDIGSRSSSAWLEVESAKGKRKQTEEDSDDKTGWKGKLLEEDVAKKLRQGEGHENQDSLSDFRMGKDGQFSNGQDVSGEFYDSLGKDGSLGREGKMGQFSGTGRNMAEGNQFFGFAGESGGLMGLDQNTMLGGSSVSGGPGGLVDMGALYGKDAMMGGVSSGAGFGGVGGLHAVQGHGIGDAGAEAGIGGAGAGRGEVEGFYDKKGVLGGPGGRATMLDDVGGLYDKDGVRGHGGTITTGASDGLHVKDGMLAGIGGAVARGGVCGEEGMLNGVGITKDSAGSRIYGRDSILDGASAGRFGAGHDSVGRYYGKNMLSGVGAGTPGGAGDVGGLQGKEGVFTGVGSGGPGATNGMAVLSGKGGMVAGTSSGGVGGAGGVDGFHGKDGILAGAGAGRAGGTGGVAGLYGKDGMLAGTGAGGAGGVAGLFGRNGMPAGGGAGGPGGIGSVPGLYGKDGMLVGAGSGGPGGVAGLDGKDAMLVGIGTGGAGGAGDIARLYDEDGMLVGGGAGGPGGVRGVVGLYGNDGILAGGGAGGLGGAHSVGGLYGKNAMLAGVGVGGPGGAGGVTGLYSKDGMLARGNAGGYEGAGSVAGLYGKDSMLAGGAAGGCEGSGGAAGLYGKDGMLAGAGVGGPRGAGGMAGFYGKDGMIVGADIGGPGAAGGVAGLYGKDGVLEGVGVGGPGGAGGVAELYGKDDMLAGAGVGGPGGAGGVAGLYGKNGVLVGVGVGGPGGAGSVAGLYGKDGVLAGGVAGGSGGAGSVAGLYGKDSMLAGGGAGGPGGAGGIAGLYGKDGMLAGGGAGGFGGAGGIAGFFGKDNVLAGGGAGGPGSAGGVAGLYSKDGMLAGGGVGGSGVAVAVAGLYGRDGVLAGAGADGPGGASGVAGLYGKDGMLAGGGVGGSGVAVAGLYGRDGVLAGVGADGPGGTGGVAGLYGKDGMLAGGGVGGSGVAVAGLYGRDGVLAGAGADGPGGAGGVAGLYGKDGMLADGGAGGPGGAGGVAGLYGKDGMLAGVRAGGPEGAGGVAGLYGKDGMLAGVGAGGPGVAGGVAGLYGKDGMLAGVGAGGPEGAGGVAGLYGKDGMLAGVGAGGPGVAGGVAGLYGKDGMLTGAGAGGPGVAGGVAGLYGKDGMLAGASAGASGGAGSVAALYGKDGMLPGDAVGGHGVAEGVAGLYGKDGMLAGVGAGGLGGAGSVGGLYGNDVTLDGEDASRIGSPGGKSGLYGKDGVLAGTIGRGAPAAGAGLYGKDGVLAGTGIDGVESVGGIFGKDGRPAGAGVAGLGGGAIGGLYDRDGKLEEVGAGGRHIDGSLPGVPGEEYLSYNQLYDGDIQAGDRKRQLSGIDASGLISADVSRKRDRKGRGGSLLEEDMREPHSRFTQGLFDVRAQKGKSAVLSCSLNNDHLEGTWFKDGFKVTGLEGISVEKDGPVHKLIIDEVQDSHAGKYKFETEGIRTEASLFVEDPPNVDTALLEKLRKEPVVVKAGKNALVKIPFEGQKPIRATWLKDDGALLDDVRIHTDHSDNFTRLSISSTNRKDCGDYKVKLKNDSGSLEATLKLVVIDKPQPPVGPIEVVDTSASGITIQWKPPKDDGGKPIQRYIIERQQVGRKTWLTLGETRGSSTVFTTNKVEHDKSYYFKVKAVNAEGTGEALESEEVMAATKVFPGPPAPPKIVSANKGAISVSWAPPHKTGNSRISGYTIEKCKKGSNTWTPVSDLPITDRKYTVTDLKEGLQYEFRVAAINNAGVGEASSPSEAVFARDPMKPPGPVRDLKMVSADYTSISLSWMKPESEEESQAKGYIVEIRHSDILKWTQCNPVPIPMASYTVRGLKPKEMYFLRVRAVNDGGLGDPVELDTCIQTVPPSVHPKLLINDTMKSFMMVKAGNTIRVRIPFEASPNPEVIWLKDGLSLPHKATTATREGLTQIIVPGAEFSDSGLYTITLQTERGKKETFSFLVQVTDVPESPGPIQLVENVPDTVTLIWEPSPTEKRENNLYYMVMKRDASKGSWEMVSDLIYTNKCTVSNFVPGREYYFRVLAKNYMGISDPSETVQPWSIHRAKGKFEVRLPRYKGVNQNQPPRFLVQLKPHIVTLGFDCHMSCAVTGYPVPQITWYKDGKSLSQDPSFFSKNDFGVCSLVIPGVTPSDEGEYKVVANNALGQAVSKAIVTIKESTF
ncbi:immunoglobulin-like and fibronectin type III domain-containing protein 1 [Eublepharis macularius]|uniref:immunoglobulin-like and fibronectin type III domain-containing protein 1 n=1 Tax=Eublepharis macularius TaxID=481883 RepID=UPI0024105EE1|nr:immunoglobulin-like and fibronectin type III domain-containing protein 1 [Eublepharis macularius]